MRCAPRVVVLTNVETKETHNFKSIYSAVKFIGRNLSSVRSRMGLERSLKSKVDTCEYRVESV